MQLTIGMAVYDDFHGAVFTCQSLALHHALGNDCEIIIVDNNPFSAHGRDTRGYAESVKWRGNHPLVRYVPMPEATGTTQPRERIFAEAHGEIVLVMDPHVLLAPGSLERLLAYYREHPDCQDLLSGPLLYDSLEDIETQFDPVWNVDTKPDGQRFYSEMWGRWGHDPRGDNPDGEPFPIWAQGLGLFSCRRDAWLGFNRHFRGFGGEEGYIHEKFRQAGRQALCLPFLRWWHRFGRPDGVPYPLSRWNKVRNYVLGHQELGLDVGPIHEHFVQSGLFPQSLWDYLLADPILHEREPTLEEIDPRYAPQTTLQELAQQVAHVPRDLDQHAQRLAGLAQGKRILLFGKRREWDLFLLAGQPISLESHNSEHDPWDLATLADRAGIGYVRGIEDSLHTAIGEAAEPYDLIILDTEHSAPRLQQELDRYHGHAQRILIRSTGAFGEQAEASNQPGLNYALRAFLEAHSDWFVSEHREEQYGWTIISRVVSERPENPVWPWDPGFGPGAELGKLLKSIGISDTPSCDCRAKRAQMNRWGVAGCTANREQIVTWMREGSERWGYAAKLRAAAAAAGTGLAFQLNWLDPYPSLVDLAIAKAREIAEVSPT